MGNRANDNKERRARYRLAAEMFHFKGPLWLNAQEENKKRTCKYCGDKYRLDTNPQCEYHPGEYTRLYFGMAKDCQHSYWSCCDKKGKNAKGCMKRGKHVEGYHVKS